MTRFSKCNDVRIDRETHQRLRLALRKSLVDTLDQTAKRHPLLL